MKEAIFRYFLSRLKEPSTWRGIIGLLTALGVYIKPEIGEAIIALGMALAGGVAVLTPDSSKLDGVSTQGTVQVSVGDSGDKAAAGAGVSGFEDLDRWSA